MTAAGLELEGKPVRYTEEEFGPPGAHYDVVVTTPDKLRMA